MGASILIFAPFFCILTATYVKLRRFLEEGFYEINIILNNF